MEVFNSEQSAQPQINFVREGVKIGLINGAIALLLMYGSYYAGLDSFVTVQFISKFIPYMMIILIIYGFQLRKRNGGYLAFRDGLKYSFMSYVIVAILVAIGTYILFNVVDKNLTQKAFDLSLEKMKSTFVGMGMKEEEIEKAMGKRETQKTDFPTIFLGTGFGLIWDFIVSLVVALIIRREKPVF
jgi:hypothetical protein